MEKIKQVPETSQVFQQVASVIGDVEARKELERAAPTFSEADWDDILTDDADLHGAFYWYDTPQGYDFWGDISEGINPLAE